MHPLWKGAVSFGLVNIPVAMFSGLKRSENIRFNLLRKSDSSRIRNKRVAEADDKEVPWNEIVKGYEYARDKYVVLTDAELQELGLRSTRVIDLSAFVDREAIDPVYFSSPYLLQAEKGGEKAYQLLVEILESTRTAAIAKVVLRGGREHLVALLARDGRLVADFLHFEDELQPVDSVPAPDVKIAEREREIARRLVESMKAKWNPDAYRDDYEAALKALIARKLSGRKIRRTARKEERPTNVIDLFEVLQKSLRESGGGGKRRDPEAFPPSRGRAARKGRAGTRRKVIRMPSQRRRRAA